MTPRFRHRSSVPGRWTLRTALALIVLGLSALALLGWEYVGTNWLSEHKQHAIADQLDREWADPATRVDFTPTKVALNGASALVRIPRISNQWVPVLEGANEDNLAKGFAHFVHTADPGKVGNYVLAGHRITHGQPLRDMPDLRPGDRVIVRTATTTYTYVLDTNPNDLVVPFTAGWILAPVPRDPGPSSVEPAQRQRERLITLVTCSELFHTDNRMVAFGHLVGRTPAG